MIGTFPISNGKIIANKEIHMAYTREQLLAAALELEPAEREALAEELWLSLTDAEQEQIDREVLEEAERDTAEYEAGRTVGRPVEEVLDRLLRKTRS